MPVDFVEAPNNFYLGASVDPETHEIIQDRAVYYDARDLTTHGVILGMTGSGKSGLGIVLLEEAALDGIPQLVIDPKGDITNMLLAFPDVSSEHFREWINPEDAPAGQDVDAYTESVANEWHEGLERWGITVERLQEYRRSSRFAIYTPGSEAGLPVSVLASFARPPGGWEGNEEHLRDRITGIVSAILGLIGVNAKPLEDPEHILLSNIFEYNWRNDADLSMEKLILHVQDPPFAKLGVLDVDTVLPQSDRLELAKKLNHLISAPSFQSWTEGQTLEIPSLLYTDDGYPCTSIFYIAHLSEAEQQFIVALLLENVLSWMSTLSGSSSLRAVVYIDEVFGMFPPHPHQPTTKRPLMKLLKQARAFGIGMVLGTQNAKDIDYKGLSNAGTWWIGKLQTENDRKRVLEGLDTASRVESEVDLGRIAGLIGRLNPREFILHNVHAEQSPILMRTRWAMSYLRGPLTKQQISALMANQRGQPAARAQNPRRMLGGARPTAEQTGRTGGIIQPRARIPTESRVEAQAAAADLEATDQPVETPSRAPTYSGDRRPGQPPGGAPVTQEDAPAGFAPARPSLSSSAEQYFLPAEFTFDQALRNRERAGGLPAANVTPDSQLLYVPSLLAQLTVRFSHRQTNTQDVLWYAFIVPDLPRMAHIDWELYQAEPFDPTTLELQPYAEAYYADIPPALTTGSSLTDLRKSLVDWVYNNLEVTILHNPALDLYNGLDESASSFRERVQQAARQRRDEAVDKVMEKYSRQFDRLEDRIENRASRLEAAEEELGARRTEGLVTTGETALRLMRGQLYRTVSRVAQLRRYSQQNEERIEMLEGDLVRLMEELDEAEAQMEQELAAIRQQWAEAARRIEEVPVRPNKTDITPALFGIGWVPYWRGTLDGAPVILPASSSLLCEQQGIVQG